MTKQSPVWLALVLMLAGYGTAAAEKAEKDKPHLTPHVTTADAICPAGSACIVDNVGTHVAVLLGTNLAARVFNQDLYFFNVSVPGASTSAVFYYQSQNCVGQAYLGSFNNLPYVAYIDDSKVIWGPATPFIVSTFASVKYPGVPCANLNFASFPAGPATVLDPTVASTWVPPFVAMLAQ
jgi:hypothetical protein